MIYSTMETQAHMEMAHEEMQEEKSKELVDKEEQFLKELYLFMRKRDTPIERIPHLGFKQIDLFVMFNTVRDLGGYHQVTAQQLWKQVYNRLGGNPRSTSAATCTRRHYEKLLLPYECHKKGILMNMLPQHQSKLLIESSYSKDENDGQRPAKRKLISVPLHQSTPKLHSDPRGNIFPLTLHYPQYHHPSHPALPVYTPISSSAPVMTQLSPPSPEPPFTLHPSRLNPTDRVKEPLEHLRHLAEQYKSSSGLMEPLNLSIKASSHETITNPTSSFTPPSSSKSPKFLNKPSPLYAHRHPPVVRNEGGETQDAEAEVAPHSVKEGGAYVVDDTAVKATSSPMHDFTPTLRADGGATAAAAAAAAQNPSSPQGNFPNQPKEEAKSNPEAAAMNLNYMVPNVPQNNGGKMEIEIPLSMLHTWLRLCGSSAMVHAAKQFHAGPPPEEQPRERACSEADIQPTNLSLRTAPQHWRPAAADLRMRQRNMQSPTPTPQTVPTHPSTNLNHFTSFKSLPSAGLLKNPAGREVFPFDQRDIVQSHGSKSSNSWDAYDKETQVAHVKVKTDTSPRRVQQDSPAARSHYEDAHKAGRGRSEVAPSSVFMMNPSSALFHLTTEEVMKLKKIISSSS
ncbi:ARID domain containing [Solea senegalensis]|uniref:ARID domain containing n=2 Tax=Solea senegalensis TaxID=28829 RepID=A0AAV6R1L8_SOLSE|nr:AT-rich interaction domain 6 [Solea senegalensis]KAG7499454.1 ARID domain containing [Solea senegalensis]